MEEEQMSFSEKLDKKTALTSGILEAAAALGADPVDLATIISYETSGTFDARKKGPETRHGQHKGLLQFGEPQAKQHGVDFTTNETAMTSQLGASGAIVDYFLSNGYKKGMGLLDMYSIVNTGGPGNYNYTDAASGGMPGTVRDKVNTQMDGHKTKAINLLGNETKPLIPVGNPLFHNGFGSALLDAKSTNNTSNSTVSVSDEANDEDDSANTDVSSAMDNEANARADTEASKYSAYMMQNNPYQDSRRVLVNAPSVQTQSFTEERQVAPFRSLGQSFALPYKP